MSAPTLIPRPAPSRPEERHAGWCPACRKIRPGTLATGTTDWQLEPVVSCDTCGAVIHDLLAPLAATTEVSTVTVS